MALCEDSLFANDDLIRPITVSQKLLTVSKELSHFDKQKLQGRLRYTGPFVAEEPFWNKVRAEESQNIQQGP